VSARQYLFAAVLALVIVCATILGALGVVNAERVFDMLSIVVASFLGGLSGAGLSRSSSSGGSLKPPPRG
jgi:hypothetical protein